MAERSEREERAERLAKLAAASDCVVTLAQLIATGYSEREIRTAIEKKLWQRLQVGVFLLAAGKATWRQRVRAAMLAAGGEAQLFGRTLAAWAGLDGSFEGVIEIVVPHGHAGPKPKGVTVHRTRHMSKVRKYDGLAGTTVERLLVDYAAHVSTDLAECAVESALTKGLTHERRVWRELATLPEEVPGVRALARIMDLRPAGKAARSVLEVETLKLIRKSDLPMPVRNHDVWVDGDHFEIDMAYLANLGAIEVDSKRWHSTASQKAKDKLRQAKLEAAGWTFVRVRTADVYGRPEWVVDQIRDLVLTPKFEATDRAS